VKLKIWYNDKEQLDSLVNKDLRGSISHYNTYLYKTQLITNPLNSHQPISPAMNISDSGNAVCHVVAMPFPGRGHINPMLSFCKILTSQKPNNLLITFVLTEEWLTFIGADPKPESIRFATIPNVIPPEREKAGDFPGFYEAVMTKMEEPFEKLLDQLELPVDVIVGDVELRWPVDVGNRRNVPVAAFWTMSASFYSMLHHLDVFSRNQQLTVDKLGNYSFVEVLLCLILVIMK